MWNSIFILVYITMDFKLTNIFGIIWLTFQFSNEYKGKFLLVQRVVFKKIENLFEQCVWRTRYRRTIIQHRLMSIPITIRSRWILIIVIWCWVDIININQYIESWRVTTRSTSMRWIFFANWSATYFTGIIKWFLWIDNDRHKRSNEEINSNYHLF